MPVADDSHARAVKAGHIDPDKSRIVVFLGRVITPGSTFSPSLDWGNSQTEIFVNGRDAGGIHAGEALAIEVRPGQYALGSGDGPERQNSPALTVTLGPRQIAYLSKDTMMRRQNGGAFVGGMVGGAIGGALAGAIDSQTSEDYQGPLLHLHDDGLALIQDRQIIVSAIRFQ
jgi:hypothetical protein